MIVFIFGKEAKRKFFNLEKVEQERVSGKLAMLKNHTNIFSILTRLKDFGLATHRLRIGNIRVILRLEKHDTKYIEFFILNLGDRKDIYK